MRNLYLEYVEYKEKYLSKISEGMLLNEASELISGDSGNINYRSPVFPTTSVLEEEYTFLESMKLIHRNKMKEIELALEKAESNKLVGLSLPVYMECDDFMEKTKSYIRDVMDSAEKAFLSGDISDINQFTSRFVNNSVLIGPEGELPMIDLVCCNKKTIMNECFTIIENKQITKEILQDAKEFLESYEEKITEAQKEVQKKSELYREKAAKLQEEIDKNLKAINGDCNIDKEKHKIGSGPQNESVSKAYAAALVLMESDLIERSAIVQLETQLMEMNTQAKKIILAAAMHQPRDIKNSNKNLNEALSILEYTEDCIYEECMSICEDTEQYIQEAALKDKLDSFKVTIAKSNEKFVNKYAEDAKKYKGNIVIDKWYETVDIESKYKKAMQEVDKVFKLKSDATVEELKEKKKEIMGTFKDNIFSPRKATGSKPIYVLFDDHDVVIYKNFVMKEILNHKLTKKDVDDAINYLKNSQKEIDNAQKRYTDLFNSIYFGKNTNKAGRTKGEKITTKIEDYKYNIIKSIEMSYSAMVMMQLKMKQKQARLVLLKAARVKAIDESVINDLENVFEMVEECVNLISNK